MSRLLKGIFDWTAIIVGLITLIALFVKPDLECLDFLGIVAAVFCGIYVVYAGYAGYLLLFRIPQFEWHLLYGHFLRKVVCLVLLMPFLLTGVISCSQMKSEELVYDDNLYKSEINECSLKERQSDPPLLWGVYYHFIDPGNQHMTSTEKGRGWAGLIAILGVFLMNGLLVSSIIGWIDRRKEKWLKGEIKYRCFLSRNKHYVIVGGNDMVAGIVRQILSNGKYILILTSRDVESFRRELFSSLTEEQQQHIIIYYGNRTSKEDISNLCLCQTEEVYILGEETRVDDIESYHDTMNMKCLELISDCLEGAHRNDKLVCRVMFEYQTTFSVFQFYDIEKKVQSIIDFKPFNYYEMWAQKVFVNKEIDSEKLEAYSHEGGYLPLEGPGGIKKDDGNYVHLFIVGMSRMGVAMGLEAAHLAHYPNYEQKKIRTKITFIDKNATEEKDFFIGRFKELFNLSHWRYGAVDEKRGLEWQKSHVPLGFDYLGGDFLDIEWEFINGGIELNAIQDYILESSNSMAKVTIAICLPESNRSHASGLYLHKKIYDSKSVLQVLVYNRYGNSIIKAFHSEEPRYPYLNKLKYFGAPEDCFDAESLAQSENIGHAIGNRYTEINDLYIKPAKEKVGQVDTKIKYKGKSQVANFWSNIYNGNTLWTKLRSIGYKGCILFPEQISLLSDVEHNRWNVEQLLMNFRPLTQEEQTDVIDRKKDKEVLKGEMAHLNICSNKRLKELRNVDVAARAYDEGLTALLPDIYSQLVKS